MKNTLNKKDDSRAMSRWVEANKSRSAGISITRRPGSKGGQEQSLEKADTAHSIVLISDPWSAALLLCTALYSAGYKLVYFVFVSILRIRVACFLSLVCATMAREACKKRVDDVDKEEKDEEKMERAGRMSDDKKE